MAGVVIALGLAACSRSGAADRDGDEPSQATSAAGQAPAAPTPVDWKAVDQAMGKAGTMQPGDVYRVALPRSDLHVTVGSVAIKPALALGGWVAMKQTGANDAMAMGDLVLTEEEVGPVMAKLQEGGVEQTALHNHLLHESPRVLYMHIHAHGDPIKIASAVHAALALTKIPLTAAPAPTTPAPGPTLDTGAVAAALGQSGKLSGVVYQVSVPRAESIRDAGMDIPPAMGVATAINIQPTAPGKAATTGDFVLMAGEVNPVIQALTQNGLVVTAIHSHMLTDEPRLFFMHFWGNEDVAALTRGLRAALDKTNSRRQTASR